MKFGSKKGWRSIVPLRLRGKSVTRFCLFSKVKPAGYGPGNTPVYLNVYDLTLMTVYAYWAGFGIFHSGVEGHAGCQNIKDGWGQISVCGRYVALTEGGEGSIVPQIPIQPITKLSECCNKGKAY